MIIVYCFDENYKDMAELSIKSVRKYNPNAKIYVASPDVFFVEGVDKLYTFPTGQHKHKEGNDRITDAAYLKCMLPDIIEEDKVIYIDPDIECLGSLNELWEIPCQYINICESHNYGKQQAEALGLERYGIAGMMVMNLKSLRAINFTQKCSDVEKMPIPSKWWQHDETCINVAMKDKLTFIDKKWSYCRNREYDEPVAMKDVKLLHYVGRDNKEDFRKLNFYKNIQPILNDIKGKNVAIVGNAKSLFDKNDGDKIDRFDFVIRFNKGFINEPEKQGTKTDMLMLACELSKVDVLSYKARYVVNRSKSYINELAQYTISNKDRRKLKERLNAQPSTGFMAIDLCLTAGASSITLFGFDFEKTLTFYNPEGYQTAHDYNAEESIVMEYVKNKLVRME